MTNLKVSKINITTIVVKLLRCTTKPFNFSGYGEEYDGPKGILTSFLPDGTSITSPRKRNEVHFHEQLPELKEGICHFVLDNRETWTNLNPLVNQTRISGIGLTYQVTIASPRCYVL